MIGDVLLLEGRHRRAAGRLAEEVAGLTQARPVVAVGGESGTGKSEVAHELARALKGRGRRVKVLHLDNYYRTLPAERTAWRQRHGLEAVGDGELDWPRVAEHVAAFRDGRPAALPCVDLLSDQVDRLETDFAEVEVLVIEGLYAVKAPADLRVMIDLTYRETRKAQLLRGKEPENELRARVLEREHQAVQALRGLADLLITPEFEVVAARLRGS